MKYILFAGNVTKKWHWMHSSQRALDHGLLWVWRSKLIDLKFLRARFFHTAQHLESEKKFQLFSFMYVYYLCLDTERRYFFFKLHLMVTFDNLAFFGFLSGSWALINIKLYGSNLYPSSPRWWYSLCASSWTAPAITHRRDLLEWALPEEGSGLWVFETGKGLKE